MKRITKKQREVLGDVMRELGRLGGKASAKKLTAAERTEKARKAGKARQAKARAKKKKKKGGRR
jgi:hypothetical protein